MIQKDKQLEGHVLQFLAESEASGEFPPGAGIAVSIIQADKILYQGAFGLRDRECNLPVTTKTIFDVSSVTKGFTATAFLMAHEEGRIDLDRPLNLSKSIVELKDHDVSQRLSISDILSHRTGLPSHDCLWYFGPGRIEDLVTRLQHLDLIPQGFHKVFVYNNLLYGTLGVICKELLGESWENYVTRRILDPLKMKSSSAGQLTAGSKDNVAIPYVGRQRVKRKELGSIAAAIALRSNIEDMTRWMAFLLNPQNRIHTEKVISGEAVRQTHSEQIRIEHPNPLLFQGLEWLNEKLAYGFGWFLGEERGLKAIYHPGLIDGFSSALVLFPEIRMGFTVLTNVNMNPIPGRLIQSLFFHLLGETIPEAEPKKPDPAPAEMSSTQNSRAIHNVAGTYEDPAYGVIEVIQTREDAFLRYYGNEWQLEFQGADQAGFTVTAFGLQLPISANFELRAGQVKAIHIPFSFDSRVGPQVFVRS